MQQVHAPSSWLLKPTCLKSPGEDEGGLWRNVSTKTLLYLLFGSCHSGKGKWGEDEPILLFPDFLLMHQDALVPGQH